MLHVYYGGCGFESQPSRALESLSCIHYFLLHLGVSLGDLMSRKTVFYVCESHFILNPSSTSRYKSVAVGPTC